MANLAKQLEGLAATHGLNAVSIHLHIMAVSGRSFFSANAHANGICTQGMADTPEVALAAAIEEINARRAVTVSVPELEQAA